MGETGILFVLFVLLSLLPCMVLPNKCPSVLFLLFRCTCQYFSTFAARSSQWPRNGTKTGKQTNMGVGGMILLSSSFSSSPSSLLVVHACMLVMVPFARPVRLVVFDVEMRSTCTDLTLNDTMLTGTSRGLSSCRGRRRGRKPSASSSTPSGAYMQQ